MNSLDITQFAMTTPIKFCKNNFIFFFQALHTGNSYCDQRVPPA